MPFIVDLITPSQDIEAASALSLAITQRKSKGLFGRKQHEPIQVLARLVLPLKTVAWTPSGVQGRCLAFDPQGLVSGSIRFDLAADVPEFELDAETGEEAFIDLCQKWTKQATDHTPTTLEFTGLITQPDQVAPLLGNRDAEPVELEQKADIDGTLGELAQQLQSYEQAAQVWTELQQKVYTHRDALTVSLKQYAQEEREAGRESLAALKSQVETALATKASETEEAQASAQEDYQQRRDMLQEELARFQAGFKESGDAYWREQIKNAEKNISENHKAHKEKKQALEDEYKEFEKQQRERIHEFQQELDKRLAAYDARLQRLDTTLDGLSKGLEQRLAAYQQQPQRVLAATLELAADRVGQDGAVFYAARYPGNRWQVFPPQVLGSRGILGAVTGLLGRLNLPFKPASKLAETLAENVQKLLPGSELEAQLVADNLLQGEDFLASAQTGLGRLIDQGQLDKKHADLFAEVSGTHTEEQPAGAEEKERDTQPEGETAGVEETEQDTQSEDEDK